METWNRLTAARGKGAEGKWWREGEGISQRTCMKGPWTRTTVWGWAVGVGGGLGGGRQRAKNRDNCNRINKNFKKIQKKGEKKGFS